jgi:hypothetical protein
MDIHEQRARAFVRRHWFGATRLRSRETSRQRFRGSAIKCIPELIEAARESGDKIVIEELRHRGRDMRAQGAKVPDNFSLFVWEWFLDGPPKVKRGPKAYDRLDRDQILAGLVRIVVEEFEFPATRGEPAKESDSTVSACQIVAEETGHEEAAVGEIWKNSLSKERMENTGPR